MSSFGSFGASDEPPGLVSEKFIFYSASAAWISQLNKCCLLRLGQNVEFQTAGQFPGGLEVHKRFWGHQDN